jgi:hypothetical protein
MPSMNVVVAHTLGQMEAVNRLKSMLQEVKDRYAGQISNLEETWRETGGDFSFSAMGFKTSGTIEIEEHEVRVGGHLPLAAALFKGRIEDAIRDQISRKLA